MNIALLDLFPIPYISHRASQRHRRVCGHATWCPPRPSTLHCHIWRHCRADSSACFSQYETMSRINGKAEPLLISEENCYPLTCAPIADPCTMLNGLFCSQKYVGCKQRSFCKRFFLIQPSGNNNPWNWLFCGRIQITRTLRSWSTLFTPRCNGQIAIITGHPDSWTKLA